ncbi:MAG TPA: hypothetical protein VEF76_11025 [Patescibacteria group bacterium]|nr:hypothetical protein [Patescibacteria group bacterium]
MTFNTNRAKLVRVGKKMKSGNTLIIVIAVAAFLGAGIIYKNRSTPPPTASAAVTSLPVTLVPGTAPRNEAPLDEYSRFYKRKTYRVTDAGREFFQPGQNVQYDLTYWWFQPAGGPYPAGLKFPLVLVLHGSGGNAYAGKYLITSDMQLNYPAFIVAPVLPQGWLWSNPHEFAGHPDLSLPAKAAQGLPGTVQLIRKLMGEYPVDPTRIYVIGCSLGGMGAFGAVRNYSDVFAAAMPLSGGWNLADAPQMTKVPMWVLQGGQDTAVPADIPRSLAAAIHRQGGRITYTELPNMAHECPSSALYGPAIWKWLFSQKKAG